MSAHRLCCHRDAQGGNRGSFRRCRRSRACCPRTSATFQARYRHRPQPAPEGSSHARAIRDRRGRRHGRRVPPPPPCDGSTGSRSCRPTSPRCHQPHRLFRIGQRGQHRAQLPWRPRRARPHPSQERRRRRLLCVPRIASPQLVVSRCITYVMFAALEPIAAVGKGCS